MIEEITNKLWSVKHLTHKVVGRNGFAEIFHECAIVTDEGQKVAAVNLEFLGLDVVPRSEAEWKLAEHLVSAHNTWLAFQGHTPEIDDKTELTEAKKDNKFRGGNVGKWWTDGTRDVKAKECPPGFRPGRTSAFKRKDVGHEEASQTQAAQSPVVESQLQAQGDGAKEERVQEIPYPQTGEGWFRP